MAPEFCPYFWHVKQNNYKYLLYFITTTIGVIIAIQLYWNSQNYKANKKRLLNEVQISFDNSVETYFTDMAKTDFFSFIEEKENSISTTITSEMFEYIEKLDSEHLDIEHLEHGIDSCINHSHLATPTFFPSVLDTFTDKAIGKSPVTGISIFHNGTQVDSIGAISGLINKLTVSITKDSIDFVKLDTILKNELARKDISINYGFTHFKNDSVFQNFNIEPSDENLITTFSKATYLPFHENLQLKYSNPTLHILKRSLTGILLSLLLAVCTIACLFYLLHIINKQKELAEIKNDLISNITHEFKTPIATVTTAIEGIKNFNEKNDKEKTNTYLNISDQQLKKLHLMVEKLLETATLDNDKLLINKEDVDLVMILKNLVDKYQMLCPEKTILFKTTDNSLSAKVDPFHFENALANLIDNAVKYGGDTIEVNLNSLLNAIEITIADNGGNIAKSQRDKIFDKFYRVPTGNIHDVKGFGIGLFYAKKIVEKHQGELALIPDAKNTKFKIAL